MLLVLGQKRDNLNDLDGVLENERPHRCRAVFFGIFPQYFPDLHAFANRNATE
jgi:hypothetical protein